MDSTQPTPPALRGRDHGFTLIEVLVVVIVIGLLSAIAVPVYLTQREKAVAASVQADMRQAKVLLLAHKLERPPGMSSCFTAANCAAGANGPVQVLDGLGMVWSPNVTVGDFWDGSQTFFVCVEHSTNGVPDHWAAFDGVNGGVVIGSGSTQGCKWNGVNTLDPGR